jgi:hypothetical protein
MQRSLKRILELQLGRCLSQGEYDRVAEMMQTLQRLTREMKAAFKNDPAKYDLLVWQVVSLGDKIIGGLL